MRTKDLAWAGLLVLAIGCGDSGSTATGTGTGSTTGASTSSGSGSVTLSTSMTSNSGSTTTAGNTTTGCPTGCSTGTTGTGTGSGLCGDGNLNPGEECDDGNTDNGDTCRSDCTLPYMELWTKSWDGDAHGPDQWNDVVTDSDGNIYVVGVTRASGVNNDLLLRAYDPDGNELWSWTYDGTDGLDDYGTSLAFHPDGNLLITGSTQSTATGHDVLVIKFDTGTQTTVWTDTFDGTSTGSGTDDYDEGRGIAPDSSGNVLVLGTIRTTGQAFDVWLRQYDADGNMLWDATYDGVSNGNAYGEALAVDGSDNVWIAAQQQVTGVAQGWLGQYDSGGNQLQTQTDDWEFTSIGFGPDGNPVIGGQTDSGTGYDARISKYGTDFTLQWSVTFDGGTNNYTQDLWVGDDGAVYYTGNVGVVGEQGNVFAAKADTDGNALWSMTYNNTDTNLDDGGLGITVDGDGNVLVCGYETILGDQQDAWLRKLQQL